MSDNIARTLLSGWEDMYKKSQLTLWILLSLRDGEKSMSAIKVFIEDRTTNTIHADDQSMYRALRRFDVADLITSRTVPSASGPDVKLWHLTKTGKWVLEMFIEKNIKGVFFNSENKTLFV